MGWIEAIEEAEKKQTTVETHPIEKSVEDEDDLFISRVSQPDPKTVVEAEQRFIASESVDPFGAFQLGKRIDAEKRAGAIATQAFTPGGEHRPILDVTFPRPEPKEHYDPASAIERGKLPYFDPEAPKEDLSTRNILDKFSPLSAIAGVGELIGAALPDKIGEAFGAQVIAESPTGHKVVESVTSQALRTLASPVAGLAGLTEAFVYDQDVETAVANRIAGGETFMYVLPDFVDVMLEDVPMSNAIKNHTKTTAGIIGFGIDMVLPIVPGAGAAQGISVGTRTSKAVTALGGTAQAGIKAGVKAGTKAAVTGFADDFGYKIYRNKFKPGVDPYQLDPEIIAKYANDAGNKQKVEDAWSFANYASENGATDDTIEQLFAEWESSFNVGMPYDDFITSSSSVGVDVTTQGIRELKRNTRSILSGAIAEMSSTKELDDVIGDLLTAQTTSQDELLFALQQHSHKMSSSQFQDFLDKLPEDARFLIDEALTEGTSIPSLDNLSVAGKDAVVKSLLYKNANDLISPSTVAPSGGFTRISSKGYIPDSSVPKLHTKMQDSVVGRISKRDVGPDNVVRVHEDDWADINDHLNMIYDEGVVPRYDRLHDREFTLQEWNKIVDDTNDWYARALPSYKGISDIGQELSEVTEAGAVETERYINKVLTTKVLRGSEVEVKAKAAIRKLKGSKASTVDPFVEETVAEIGARLASIGDDFRVQIKQVRGEGIKDLPNAWANVMTNNYTRHLDEIIKAEKTSPGIASMVDLEANLMWAKRGELAETPEEIIKATGARLSDDDIKDIKTIATSQMFDDFIGRLYGGYDKIEDAMQTSSGITHIDGALLDHQQTKVMVSALVKHSLIKPLKERFVQLVNEGNSLAALQSLFDAHVLVDGRPIGQFIRSQDDFARLLGKEADGLTRTEQYIYTMGAEEAPIFTVGNHMDVLSSQYIGRRQQGIIADITRDLSNSYPELFPSSRQIQERAAQFATDLNIRDIAGAVGEANPGFVEDVTTTGVDMSELWSAIVADEIGWRLVGKEKQFTDNTSRLLAQYGIVPTGAKDYSFLREVSGAKEYIDTLYPKFRPESTPQFYQVLANTIKANARSNIIAMTDSPAEMINRMPLTFKQSAQIKSGARGKLNLTQATETLDNLSIPSTQRKLDPEVASETFGNIEASLDAVFDLRKGQEAGRLGKVIDEVVSDFAAMNAVAKGGVLGGNVAPNFRFLLNNYITAPAIVYSTVGPEAGGAALKAAVGMNYATSRIMKHLGGGVNEAASAFGKTAEITEKIVVQTPGGLVYTDKMLADMISQAGITRSQASAELSENVLKDIISYSGIEAQKLRSAGKLTDAEYTKTRQFMNTWLGKLSRSGREVNVFSEIGNMTDVRFRTAVLVDALERGVAEKDAIKLARESLFDYGNTSAAEKKTVMKAFWFWTFRRNNLRAQAKNLLSHPERLRNMYIANKGFSGTDQEGHLITKDYAEFRPLMTMLEDPEIRKRIAIFGPSIPALDGVGELIDYMAFFPALITDARAGGTEKMMEALQEVVASGVSQTHPGIQAVVGTAFNIDARSGWDRGTWLDPRFMWYMQQNETTWDMFNTIIRTEAIPLDEERPGNGYYQGRQWRIRKNDDASIRAWYAIQTGLLAIGMQRNIRDMSALGSVIAGPTSDAPDPKVAGDIWSALYQTGLVTPTDMPTLQERMEMNEKAVTREFKRRTPRKED